MRIYLCQFRNMGCLLVWLRQTNQGEIQSFLRKNEKGNEETDIGKKDGEKSNDISIGIINDCDVDAVYISYLWDESSNIH